MTAEDHAKFSELHTSGNLVPADAPAKILAALCLVAEPALSGTFVSWDDAGLIKHAHND